MDYKTWLNYMSQRTGRDVSKDAGDYDLEGYYNSLKANPGQAGAYDPQTKEAHLEDTYKLPNHPTFSDQSKYHVPVVQQGGAWSGDDKEGYKFAPSQQNLNNIGKSGLQNYFNQVETSEGLDIPNNEKQSKARTEALRNISGGR